MEVKKIPNEVFFDYVVSQLREGHTVSIPLTGTSMSPLLREGRDNLVLSPLPADAPLRRYDVVLFRYRGGYLLHRIVRIDGDTVTTRGDALASLEQVPRTDIVAILTAVQDREMGTTTLCKSLKWRLLSRKTVWTKQLKRKIKRLIKR
ncbi:MAG: S24/S26 family peptidase [Bacteroidales bacterium]|nr:S24/S26 family peptidase [Bacteroidales bacterium]MBP5758666.1 S24/S26 family peptidase [Bacteroidales bacterium]